MAFVGVRRDESVQRSGYDYVSYGTKHKGQFSCNPILEWNSAEIFLYIYANNLHLNEAYKKGLSRAGCLVCPMSAHRSIYMRIQNYGDKTLQYLDFIKDLNSADKGDEKRLRSYIENIGWKSRSNGRDLTIARKDYDETFEKDTLCITFIDRFNQWKQWIKTVGNIISITDSECVIEFKKKEYRIKLCYKNDSQITIYLTDLITKDALELSKKIRRIFRKSHYCVGCRVCEANCKFGNINFNSDNTLTISDKCTKCGMCLEIDTGCLVYKSISLPKGTGNMKQSLDRYGTHAPKVDWFTQWLKFGDQFKSSHSLGNNEVPAFKKFLKDAGIAENDKDTNLGSLFRKLGMESELVWTLMLINLSYSSLVGWWVKNTPFNELIAQKFLIEKLSNTDGVSVSGAKRIPNDIKRMTLLPFGPFGYGTLTGSDKASGFLICRTAYQTVEPLAILYSLYKFAEACGDYYQFTLSRLVDKSIESDGVSPAQIFGLDKESLEKLLKGLAVNYPDYISVSFTLDLDNINLRSDKTSADVLSLF
jgi:phosphoadenosine phosphosulfate reductase